MARFIRIFSALARLLAAASRLLAAGLKSGLGPPPERGLIG
jgi:hypothetical protein